MKLGIKKEEAGGPHKGTCYRYEGSLNVTFSDYGTQTKCFFISFELVGTSDIQIKALKHR